MRGRAGYTEASFALGTWLPGDYDVDGDVDFDDFTRFEPALSGPLPGSRFERLLARYPLPPPVAIHSVYRRAANP